MSKKEKNLTTNECTAVAERCRPERVIAPETDLHETEQGWVLEADLPGVSREDLRIEVDEGVMTIEAEARSGAPGRFIHREFGPVVFRRRFQLGNQVNLDSIAAELKDGVLTLRLPKAEEAKPRKIDIRVA